MELSSAQAYLTKLGELGQEQAATSYIVWSRHQKNQKGSSGGDAPSWEVHEVFLEDSAP
jgi:hypothetical protein